jgi:acetyltransferase EpsM
MSLLIIGAGAQAKVILEICRLNGNQEVAGLIDLSPDERLKGGSFMGVPVLGGLGILQDLKPQECEGVIVACSPNEQRAELTSLVTNLNYKCLSAIHPKAVVASTATVGEGSVIHPLAVLQPFSTIGRGVVVQSHSVVSHDCILEDFVSVAPNVTIAGHVRIGRYSYVYSGATIIPRVKVGERSKLGAGAIIVRDVPAGATVMAMPSRVISIDGTSDAQV